MRAWVVAATVLIGSASGTQALEPKQAFGFGNSSCGALVEARKSKSVSSPYMEFWVVGFLSGSNWSSVTQKDFLIGMDSDALFVWLDNHCSQNPLKNFQEGVVSLAYELKSRANK